MSLNVFSYIIFENVILFSDIFKNITKGFWKQLNSYTWRRL